MWPFTKSSTLSQIYPPKPEFTEKDLPSLNGKVYIVTGANSGVGKELSRILYSKHAKVYVAARSESKANEAIEEIKKAVPDSSGELVFLSLDLSDLTTIKASVHQFLSKERTLHVLFNNAGVMMPPDGSKSAQGYELQLGVNNVGTFMFTKLLTPTLVHTAKTAPPGTVRVVWVSSSSAELMSPKHVGVPLDNLDYHKPESGLMKYAVSKAGNYFHSTEFARRYKSEGIISVALNPGNLATNLARHKSSLFRLVLSIALYPAVNGAYTELFAGLSPKITLEESGAWVVPFGRILPIRKDLIDATKLVSEGGNGVANKFWDWNEDQIRPYL